jgi:cytochrome c peroxidase
VGHRVATGIVAIAVLVACQRTRSELRPIEGAVAPGSAAQPSGGDAAQGSAGSGDRVRSDSAQSDGPHSNTAEYVIPPAREAAAAELGRALFFSPIVSPDGQVSCASCHQPEHGFADSRALSQVPGRPATQTNAPSVLNVVYLDRFNWNGRFKGLGDQLDALVQNPAILGTSWEDVARRLRTDPGWHRRCLSIFPEGCTAESTRAALLAYERSLVSLGTPFDRWLRGETAAISAEAREGYDLFKRRGCVSCHQGMLIGGNLFQRFGVVRPYFDGTRPEREADLGRFSVTRRPEDKHVFRVPSLRNVSLTAPYLHDGSMASLPIVVRVMATYQLGRELEPDTVDKIVRFLETLSGTPAGAP